MPTFDDYKRILGAFAVPTSPTPFNPSNGGADYRSEIFMDKRDEVLIGEQAMSDIRFITISSLKGKGTEPLTLYGVGCRFQKRQTLFIEECHFGRTPSRYGQILQTTLLHGK